MKIFGCKLQNQKTKARDRRIHPSEIDLVLKVLEYKRGITPALSENYVAWGFLFAIETATRRNELLSKRMKYMTVIFISQLQKMVGLEIYHYQKMLKYYLI